MNNRQVIAEIRRRVRFSGQAQLARELGVSRSYLCHILAGTRLPGPKVLKGMGLRFTIEPTNGS